MLTDQAVDLFLTSRLTRNCARNTLKWYRIILANLAAQYTEVPLGVEDIEKFILSLPGKDERRHGYYRALRAFYRFLNKRYDIPNPILKMDAPRRKRKLPKALSLENFIRLMHYHYSPDIQAYLEFIADTGCRVGELCNLRPEAFERGQYGYIVKLSGKTGERLVPLKENTYRHIIKYVPIKYKVDWLTRRISKAFKDAGVPGTAHNLRHTFATMWQGSEFALQNILGHSNFQTLFNYRRLRMDEVTRQHNRYTMMNLMDSTK